MARSPVYTALRDSPYEYMFGNVRFKFSSALHRDKFSKGLAQRIAWLNDSMSRRFKCLVDFRVMAAIQWYEMCETRGYCVEVLRDDGTWERHNMPTIELKAVLDGC